jgi:hypothetical protein
MDADDAFKLTQLGLKLTDDIRAYWNFLVVSGTVLVGWALAKEKPLDMGQAVLIALIFAVFWYFNFVALRKTYRALDRLVPALRTMAEQLKPPALADAVSAVVPRLAMRGWPSALAFQTLFVLVVLFLLIKRAAA